MRLGPLLLAALLWCAPAWALTSAQREVLFGNKRVITHISGCSQANGASTSTTVVCTLSAPAAAGDLITILAGFSTADTFVSATTDKNDVCTTADSQNNSFISISLYCPNVKGGASVITVTYSPTSPFSNLVADDWHGVATILPLDAHVINFQATPGTGTDAVTTGNATTTQAGDLIVGETLTTGANFAFSVGTGYTQGTYLSTIIGSEYKILGAAGSVAATWTSSNATDSFPSHLMAFRAK